MRYIFGFIAVSAAFTVALLVCGPRAAYADPPPTTADVTIAVEIQPSTAGNEICFVQAVTVPAPAASTFCLGDGDEEYLTGLFPGGLTVTTTNTSSVWRVTDVDCEPLSGDIDGSTINLDLDAGDDITCVYEVEFNAAPTATPIPPTSTPVPPSPTATPVPATPAPIVIVVTAVPEPTAIPTLAPIASNPFITPPNTGSAGIR